MIYRPNMLDTLLNNDLFYFLAALWVLPWKGLALWRASRKGSKIWFIVLFVVNTFALLEIIYIFFGDKLADKYGCWRSASATKETIGPAKK